MKFKLRILQSGLVGNNEASAVKMASQKRVLQGRNVKMDK